MSQSAMVPSREPLARNIDRGLNRTTVAEALWYCRRQCRAARTSAKALHLLAVVLKATAAAGGRPRAPGQHSKTEGGPKQTSTTQHPLP